MTVTSAGQALLSKATSGQLGQYPSYGMSMRFEVSVDGLSLGLWQGCKGLQVELKYKSIEQGGLYTQTALLPDRLAYGKVTLDRAVSKTDSTKVLSWLQGYVNNWRIYPRSGESEPLSTDVTITLLDFQLNPVMTWILYKARPSRWSGPTLSADGSKIAMESLEFEHEGFLFPAS